MTDHESQANQPGRVLVDAIRGVRKRYDELGRGKTATLRRCRTADEVALEGAYWRVANTLARDQRYLTHVVLLFPFATHARKEAFSFGHYLRRTVGDLESATLRLRRLLDARDRDELDHRMRGLLRLAAASGMPVDWGELGKDILWFFASSDAVRRRWTQDFYAPLVGQPSASDIASANDPGSNL
jgi:CRISPR type I-E-associated protein CasB/Cse2